MLAATKTNQGKRRKTPMSRGNAAQNALTANEFFGWKRHPFVDLPGDIDLASLVVKRDREIALRAREFIRVFRSFAIIGTPGAGKTTLAKAIIQSLEPRAYLPIWISYAGCNRSGVLRIIAEKVGLELNRKGLPPIHKLKRHLATITKDPGSPRPVIIVDDAQHLEPEAIMDLCALLPHPDEDSALACLVLIGDASLDHMLRLESRRAISSRIACIFRMEPLTPEETKSLLLRRMEIAKAPKDLFAEDAMELLAAQSRGNRRELMNLGVMLCIEAYSREEKSITAELVISKASIQ
jgi:type II secretory pathway predicted ATPase ExeA